MWGCTEEDITDLGNYIIVPTHVGVYRYLGKNRIR